MQTNYAETDQFSVVLSYMQHFDASVKEFLAQNAPTIPSFDQLEPPGAPCGGGLPDAYLFDHEGKLVGHGHPAELYPLVPALVAAVPAPEPRPILGTVVAEHLVDEANALRDPARPVAPLLKALDGLAAVDDPKGREAKLLASEVRGWMRAEVDRMEGVAERVPAQTAFHAQRFAIRFKGADTPLEARANQLARSLLELAGVKDYLRACHDLERAAATKDKKRADQFAKRALATLDQVVGSSKVSKEVSKAAQAKLQEQRG